LSLSGAPRAPPPALATAAGGGGAAATAPPAVAPVPMTCVVDAQSERPALVVVAAVRSAGDGVRDGRAQRALGEGSGGVRNLWRGRLPKEAGGCAAALAAAKKSAAAPPHGACRLFHTGCGVGRLGSSGGGGRGAVFFLLHCAMVGAPAD